MNTLRLTLVVITLLPALTTWGRQQRDSVLYRIISVDAENQPVTVILDNISRENTIFFSYDALLINNEQRITLRMSNRSVLEVLQAIFQNDAFRFIGKNNHIIISDREEIYPGQEEKDSIPAETMIVLTGTIIDQTTREPLDYVSVSLLNRPVGTITNNDGNFLLKIPAELQNDTILISNVGYARQKRIASTLQVDEIIALQSVTIRIREVKVRAISAGEILTNFRNNLRQNYSVENQLLTGFYRETLKQDDQYINVSEAVVEILKAPYDQKLRDDKVRLVKSRRSPEVQPFQWVKFKLQGGPSNITMLDVVKSLETFLDPEYQNLYTYSVSQVIWYKNHPVFVIRFRPSKNSEIPCFDGEMFIDRETYALLYASFSLDNYGLELTGQSFIVKKPRGIKVKPQFVNYQVDFSEFNGLWHTHTIRSSISFRVRSVKNKVNSVFHSVSDLLITDVRDTEMKRFPVKDLFTSNDIFVDFSGEYDEDFWGNYNIIRPDEDLQNAFKKSIPAQNLKTGNPSPK